MTPLSKQNYLQQAQTVQEQGKIPDYTAIKDEVF